MSRVEGSRPRVDFEIALGLQQAKEHCEKHLYAGFFVLEYLPAAERWMKAKKPSSDKWELPSAGNAFMLRGKFFSAGHHGSRAVWIKMLTAFCLAAALYAAAVWSYRGWFIDDAFIYQSYARSLLDGRGIAYSGHEQVEGVSSPLWLPMIAGASLFWDQGILTAKALGALIGLATLAVLMFLPASRRDPMAAFLSSILLAVNVGFVLWAVSGMETPLFAFLTLLMFAGARAKRPLLLAIAAGLTAVVRPEGVVYAAPAAIWIAFYGRRLGTASRRWPFFLVLAAPLLLLHTFRWIHFGTLLSNSAYAKLHTEPQLYDNLEWWFGLQYLANSFFHYLGIWTLCLAVLVYIIKIRPGGCRDMDLFALVLLSAAVLFNLGVKGDWMPFSRFTLPIAPAMLAWAMMHWSAAKAPIRRYLTAAAMMGILITGIQHVANIVPEPIRFFWQWDEDGTSLRTPMTGLFLIGDRGSQIYTHYMLRYTKPGDFVVHHDIGQSGYFVSDVELMDQFGLISRFECEYLHGRHSDEELIEHFRRKQPSVIFTPQKTSDGKLSMKLMTPLAPLLREDYELVASPMWGLDYEMLVLVRKDALDRTPDLERYNHWCSTSKGFVIVPMAED